MKQQMEALWIRIKKYRVILIIAIILLVAIHYFLFVDAFKGQTLDASNASDFGSFIGGYFGSIFALFSTILLAITLMEQISSYRIDKFENRFFEMLRLHRENVTELKLGDMRDREIFIALINEFKTVYDFVNELRALKEEDAFEKQNKVLSISYLILFFGIRYDKNSTLKELLSQDPNNKNIDSLFNDLKDFDDKQSKTRQEQESRFYYKYYDGHQSRLGHYYRHIFQMVDYVDNCSFLSKEEKYEYIKKLRAQLSNYEQALFFLNSLTPLGKVWWEKEYMSTYKLVKNIPQDFFKDNSINIDIKEYFNKDYFEWENYPSQAYTFKKYCHTKN